MTLSKTVKMSPNCGTIIPSVAQQAYVKGEIRKRWSKVCPEPYFAFQKRSDVQSSNDFCATARKKKIFLLFGQDDFHSHLKIGWTGLVPVMCPRAATPIKGSGEPGTCAHGSEVSRF